MATVFDQTSIALIEGVRAIGKVLTDVGVTAVVDRLEDATRKALYDVVPGPMAWIDGHLAHPHPYATALDFPLMNPFHVLVIIVLYLSTVAIGRRIMAYFDKFELKGVALIHNTVLTALSAFMTFEAVRNAFFVNNYNLFGNYALNSPKEYGMARIVWVFYVSKILEFGDTFIMVLKKNDRQISFLHLYHHTTIFFIWWMTAYFYPAGEAYFSIMQNSFVHVIMYSYYALALLKIPVPWKPYITIMQMSQFAFNMLQAAVDIWVLKVDPDWLMQVLFYYMITLLALFQNYRMAEARRVKAAKKAEAAKAGGATEGAKGDEKKAAKPKTKKDN